MWLLACVEAEEPLDRAALLDPESCAECHPTQHEQWSGSMHAYAAQDPIFLAMNARGQRETDGALGDLCINCHAPMAVREGQTTDGLNLDEVDPALLGVTCYSCHAVVDVAADHNNGLEYDDAAVVLRGGIEDPVHTGAHESGQGALHDRQSLESAAMCGSCHDVVTPAGVNLERTYAEWSATQYAVAEDGLQQTCGNCHMDGADGYAADVDGVPMRRIHDHSFPAVDIAFTDFPNHEEMVAAVQERLDPTVLPFLDVCTGASGVEITVGLENVAAGHGFPSGAAQDRRAWVQVQAWAGDTPIFSTGEVPEGVAVHDVEDPDRWTFGDLLYDADGNKVHMFWEAASYVSSQLPGLAPDSGNHVARTWIVGETPPDRVEVRLFLRPFDFDMLQSLVDSGDLDPAWLAEVPTWELRNGAIRWSGLVEPCGG